MIDVSNVPFSAAQTPHVSPMQPLPIPGQSAWDILVTQTPACVGVFDAAARCQFANAVLERGLGVLPGGLTGQLLDGVLPHALAQFFRRQVASTIEQRLPIAAVVLVRGMCWKVTLKPAGNAGAVVCIAVRLAHAAAVETRPGLPLGVPSASPADAEPPPMADLPVAPICDPGPLAVLTPREWQVLRLVGLGLTIAEMARRVHRADKTLEWHRNALGTKLAMRNRVEVARLAIDHGLTALSDRQMETLLAALEHHAS